MADLNINAVPAGKVRMSFTVTVDVDESIANTVVLVSKDQGKAALMQAFANTDPSVHIFFEDQAELSERWLAMGGGALPLDLFMSERYHVAPTDVVSAGHSLL